MGMKFVPVDQRGHRWRFWCTSNICSWPERCRRSQYTPRFSWRQRTYPLWCLQMTRRTMPLKDLHLVSSTVTTNFEASVRATMDSAHDHEMRFQASQQVAPPGIPPPTCRAQSDLNEMYHSDLTYLFFFVWWRRSPWLIDRSVMNGVVMCEYIIFYYSIIKCTYLIPKEEHIKNSAKIHRCWIPT